MSRPLGERLLAVVRPLLPSQPALPAAERAQVERDLSRALERQIGAMPRYAALPFRAALASYEWAPVLRYGRSHAELSPERQARRAVAWGRSRIGPLRDWMRLLRSCALFHFLDHPRVLAALEAEALAPPEHHAG